MTARILFVLVLTISFQMVANAQLDDSAVIRYDDLQHPVLGPAGMVAAQNRLSAEAGAQILAAGGSAVDAAIATGFSLVVTLPRAGNLGGAVRCGALLQVCGGTGGAEGTTHSSWRATPCSRSIPN